MHKGEYIGNYADKQKKRILILGESHHWDKKDWELWSDETEEQAEIRRQRKAEDYQTDDVVKRYFENYAKRKGRAKEYRFFDYIVRTFGVDPETHREDFWNKVYFGNYVEKLCGIGDRQAEAAIKEFREQYNQSLFKFIKDNKIDYVFCFSRRVYSALPQLENQDSKNETDSSDAHRLENCTYHFGPRLEVKTTLDKPVTFYGLRHTAQGFSYKKYQERIATIIQKHCLPF